MNRYARFGVVLVVAFVWVYGANWVLPQLGVGGTATFGVVLVGAFFVGRLVQRVLPVTE